MSILHRTRRAADGSIVREEDRWTIVIPDGRGKRLTRTFRGTRKEAERLERDLVAAVEASRWAEIDRTARRSTVTLQILADDWRAAGYPKPGGRTRTPAQQGRLEAFLRVALRWWGSRSPAGIGPRDFDAYGAHKRSTARTGTGERMADLELVCLHNLCEWARGTGRIAENPFANRPTYRDGAAVEHCSTRQPASDEELHAIIGHLFATGDGYATVAGAQLLFCALTGLRPGEPGALRWDAGADQPGARLTLTREGTETQVLRVRRSKGGINPAVRIHAAAAAFLRSWRQWTAEHTPDSPWMFPHPTDPTRPLVEFGDTSNGHLVRHLRNACSALGIEPRKPHAFRAFYVRVRRSQGIEDATIATELGQGSGPGLVVRTYGERLAILGGDGLFDWLPEGRPAAWETLLAGGTVVVPFARAA